MIRNILAIVLGFLTNMVLILLIEGLGMYLQPMPSMKDPQAFKNYISIAPISFHLLFLFAYAVGSWGGGLIAAAVAYQHKLSKAMIVAGISMGLGIFNLITLQHPIWVLLLSLLVFLPPAYAGAKLGIKWSMKTEP